MGQRFIIIWLNDLKVHNNSISEYISQYKFYKYLFRVYKLVTITDIFYKQSLLDNFNDRMIFLEATINSKQKNPPQYNEYFWGMYDKYKQKRFKYLLANKTFS
jgi:hypothetical protein